ncbi:hypothetical protein Y032_0174g435 [Ancylostoma ceylanicum]|uniref:Uncharacterized protein n=1 Tax=Ancylostoma ceylanicum TaxID=53326 RepID=A0A016SUU0_9BILA|nr:hypothetical protein Y032_0174g435 [Ancylostoma ceylanicum]
MLCSFLMTFTVFLMSQFNSAKNYRKRLVIGFLPYTLVFVKLRCNNWRHRMYSLFQIVCSVIAFRSFKNE